MRPNSNQRRGRGRAGRRPNIPARAQTYDSNGPGGRIRGNATQVYEKYAALARDAMAAGDRVLAEGLNQYAEHYYRIINDSTDPEPLRPPAPPREEAEAGQEANREAAESSEAGAPTAGGSAPAAPVAAGQEEASGPPRRSRRRPRGPMTEAGGTEEAQPQRAERAESAEAEPLAAEDEGLRKMLSATGNSTGSSTANPTGNSTGKSMANPAAKSAAEERPARRRKANGADQAAESEADPVAVDKQTEATPESV